MVAFPRIESTEHETGFQPFAEIFDRSWGWRPKLV